MDVRAVVVMLAVLMPLLQASGQIININLNTGGNTGGSGTAKSQVADNIAKLLKQAEGLDTGLLEPQLLDMSDAGQNMVITLLLEQTKEMQEQNKKMQDRIKNLEMDHCITKKTCCNKTLPRCPSGYERFCEKPDMCYKFSNDTKTYAAAKSACQAAGGHLAMPKDKATNDLLGKQLRARYIMNIWIGLTDEVTEGTWVWEDGTKLGTGWNNWGQVFPVPNAIYLNCAMLYNSEWSDIGCSSNMHYICEVKATA